MQTIYTAVATARGGRDGHVATSDHVLDLDLRTPGANGTPEGKFTNPEQLFACGYAACYNSALNHVARLARVKTGDTSVTAEVTLGKNDNGSFELAVTLRVNVPGVSDEVASELADAANRVCPYSLATRNNIKTTVVTTTK